MFQNLFLISIILFQPHNHSQKNNLQLGLKAPSFLQKIGVHKNCSSLAQVL